MDYAVLLNFDPISEGRLTDWIGQIADGGAGDAFSKLGMRPHLTLAEFNTDQPSDVRLVLADICRDILRPVPVKLASAGFFPGEPYVLFLAPIVDELLLDFHRLVNQALEPHCSAFSPLYREENWVPHCTLALELDLSSFSQACAVLSHHFQPVSAMAVSLSLITCCPYLEAAAYCLPGYTDLCTRSQS